MRKLINFIAIGLANTALTYSLYLALNIYLNYQMAYLIAYWVGVVIAYLFNSRFVFCVSLSWSKFLLYPFIYVIHYVCVAISIAVMVEFLEITESLAPLIAVLLLTPLMYYMNKCILSCGFNNSTRKLQN